VVANCRAFDVKALLIGQVRQPQNCGLAVFPLSGECHFHEHARRSDRTLDFIIAGLEPGARTRLRLIWWTVAMFALPGVLKNMTITAD
jgi:hypothetical protein